MMLFTRTFKNLSKHQHYRCGRDVAPLPPLTQGGLIGRQQSLEP